jgi:hypothetical protein
MTATASISKRQKIAKWYATIFTILYVILFPVVFYFSILVIAMSFGSPMPKLTVSLLSLLDISFPLSFVASIYLMWRSHSRTKYNLTYFFSALPIYAFLINALLAPAINGFCWFCLRLF